MRDAFAETCVQTKKLIYPVFVVWGENKKEEVPSMPGVFRYSVDRLGEIADVLPAHTDVYVLTDGEAEYLFPAADGVILDVDVENKRITVSKKRIAQVMVAQ